MIHTPIPRGRETVKDRKFFYPHHHALVAEQQTVEQTVDWCAGPCGCLLYTSDAADDCLSVDLGGRRIIKKSFFQAEDGIRDTRMSRGLGDVYKRQERERVRERER